jgi:hypothetical protein
MQTGEIGRGVQLCYFVAGERANREGLPAIAWRCSSLLSYPKIDEPLDLPNRKREN